MIVWLIPVAVYWSLAATYLGGAAVDFEGGGAGRQSLGLLLHFVSYLVIYGVLHMVLRGVAGPVVGAVALPLVISSILLPLAAKLIFRAVGVTITPRPTGAAAG